MKHKTATVAATEPQDWRAAAAARRAQLAAQEARLRADEVRYVKAGILRPEEAQFATAADLSRSPRATARVRSRESRPAPSRKRSLTRSSSRSGDSGDDGPSDEPPPRRLCAGCGKDIPADRSPKAEHCTNKCAANDRQRRKRRRDRERAKLPRIPTTADFRRMLEITDEELVELYALAECRCNGSHVEFDPGECFRCGHWLPRGVAA